MKITLAADGSTFTKKALAFLVTHEGLAGPDGELLVLNVQPALSPRVRAMVGASLVADYQREEAEKVLAPIERFLKRHAIAFRCEWVIGAPSDQILRAARKQGAQLLVMGTQGHGLFGRAVMGSVAQRVLVDSDIPVLLVK